MQDPIYTSTTFQRHNHTLRGILIDAQPWFVASDLARLLAMDYPQTLARRVEPYEVQEVRLLTASGAEHATEVINEAALYKALIRFGHPESRTLGRWLSEQVIPLLRDVGREGSEQPRRLLMSWESQRVAVLDWQGELWVPFQQVPTFSPFKGRRSWLGRLKGSAPSHEAGV